MEIPGYKVTRERLVRKHDSQLTGRYSWPRVIHEMDMKGADWGNTVKAESQENPHLIPPVGLVGQPET